MTPEEIAEVRALLAKACLGPLTVKGDGRQVYAPRGIVSDCAYSLCDDDADDAMLDAECERNKANAELFCAAVNALPRLLDALEAARERDERLAGSDSWRRVAERLETERVAALARAETAERERDEALAANAAAVCAWEEYGRWPDHYGAVPIGRVRYPDGREEEIALRADQITGITRGIMKVVESLLPDGLRMLKAYQDIDGVRRRAETAEAKVAELEAAAQRRDMCGMCIDGKHRFTSPSGARYVRCVCECACRQLADDLAPKDGAS